MTAVDEPVATPAAPPPGGERGSLWHRLYHGTTTFDFVGKRKYGFMVSGVIILASLLSLFTRGLNFGIDFKGGVAWEFPRGTVTNEQAEGVLKDNGITDEAKIQTLRGSNGERLRVQVGPQDVSVQTQVRNDFAKLAGVDQGEVNVTSVGPTWGDEITNSARKALIIFFIAISLYISIRFEWKMAVGALVAVFHDVFISVGVYSIFGFQVSPPTVIAFLTILGFSLYDTIVVFDKVHENAKRLGSRATYRDIVNISMNQTLMRSLNTSLAAVLPVLSLLIVGSWLMGAIALQDFAIALIVGLITGAYSSIFIATPVLYLLKSRDPRNQALEAKAASRTEAELAALRLAVTGEGSAVKVPVGVAGPAVGGAASASGAVVPPRPRKKKRR